MARRIEKYPETKTFHYYNANPKGKLTCDCVVRAICTAMDKPYNDTLKEMFYHGEISFNDEVYITNIRQKNSLQDALDSLNLVVQSIEDDMPEDFYSIDLMSAYASLGTIIGEEVGEDLVNEIFSKFCMGK